MNVIATWMGLFAFAFSASCDDWVAGVQSVVATELRDAVDGAPGQEHMPAELPEGAPTRRSDTAPGEQARPDQPLDPWEKILSPEERAANRELYERWSRGETDVLVAPWMIDTESDVHDETITTEQLRWMYEKLREVRQKEAAEKNDGGNEDSQRQP
ncbi:MAG: hypothetical protein AAFQ65_15340 [Myxococcota bacterium]